MIPTEVEMIIQAFKERDKIFTQLVEELKRVQHDQGEINQRFTDKIKELEDAAIEKTILGDD